MINEQGEVCCDTCGKVLRVGEYAFCPHGFGGSAVHGDEYPGGKILENGVAVPTRVDSKSEERALREKHGYQVKEKFCPTPGTDKDPAGVQNPEGYVDDTTMRNRQALFLRGQKVRDPQDSPTGFKTFDEGELSPEQVEKIAEHL